MIKNLGKILLVYLALSFLSSCQDTLGVDEYSKTMVYGDSTDSSTKLITYRFIDTLHDTVYIELLIDTNQRLTEYGMIHQSTLLMQEFMIWEYDKEKTAIDIPWHSHNFELYSDIELEYEDESDIPTLDFDFELKKLVEERLYDYYISDINIEFNDVKLSPNANMFEMYESSKSEIIINSKNNDYIELKSKDNLFTMIIHNVTFHPYKTNVPLLMEFEIVSPQLADKLPQGVPNLRYIYYGFNIHGLIMFY